MNTITIDIGNTRVKVAIFDENGGLVDLLTDPDLGAVLIANIGANVIYSTVRNLHDVGVFSEGQLHALQLANAIEFNHLLCKKLSIEIEHIETLGKDRLAGVMGARFLLPGRNVMVVDAGTCLTFDYLTADEKYIGGAISMGVNMRYLSLNHFTIKLPLLSNVGDLAESIVGIDIGGHTDAAIQSGVLGSVFDEIGSRMDRFKSNYADSAIIFTGGDAEFLVKHIKNEIFVEPLLVHYGLYHAVQSA
jgi:type III pantothenate kinase